MCENRAKGHSSAGELRPGCARALPLVLKRGRIKHPCLAPPPQQLRLGAVGLGGFPARATEAASLGRGARMPIPNSDFVGSAAAPPCLVRASGRSTAAAGEAAWRFGESRRRLRAVVAGWSWKHLAEGTGGRDRVGNAASARSTVTESGGGYPIFLTGQQARGCHRLPWGCGHGEGDA